MAVIFLWLCSCATWLTSVMLRCLMVSFDIHLGGRSNQSFDLSECQNASPKSTHPGRGHKKLRASLYVWMRLLAFCICLHCQGVYFCVKQLHLCLDHLARQVPTSPVLPRRPLLQCIVLRVHGSVTVPAPCVHAKQIVFPGELWTSRVHVGGRPVIYASLCTVTGKTDCVCSLCREQ